MSSRRDPSSPPRARSRTRWDRELALAACAVLAGCQQQIVYSSGDPWADPTTYPTIGAGKLIVFNGGDDTLTWIDADTFEPVFDETVGTLPPEIESPHDGTALADGSAFFVVISNYAPGSGSGPHGSHGSGDVDGYLLEYDTATHELRARVELAHNPGEIERTTDGKIVITHFDLRLIQDTLLQNPAATYDDLSATVFLVDPSAMSATDPGAGVLASPKVCPGEHGITTSDDGKTAWVTCASSDELAELSLVPPYTVIRHALGSGAFDPTSPHVQPFVLDRSPKDGTIWVSDLGETGANSGDLRVYDPATGALDPRGPITTGGLPYNGEFLDGGATFAVANQLENSLVFIDTATHAITGRLPLATSDCLNPRVPVLMPDGAHLAIVCEGDHVAPGSVAIVNLAGAAPVVEASHPAGVTPTEAYLLEAAP
jgi:DNA-binding beta-propeller fold protein YncE